MLSKNKIKLIHTLERKKERDELGVFLVEGRKMVEEALGSGFEIDLLACTEEFAFNHPQLPDKTKELVVADAESIRKASLQKNPQNVLAIVRQPKARPTLFPESELVLALDFIQDPGNLGTIMRIADWFGIQTIVCSSNTVDVYNPKVIQATMGAIFRVQTHYTDLPEYLKKLDPQIPVYGAFLDGENIYAKDLSPRGVLVMGNEGNGISEEVERLVTCKISIPSFSSGKGSESLNVAVATAICCSEFKRKSY